MGTTRQDIEGWLQWGLADGDDYCIVVCDTFDHSDYPVFTNTQQFWTEYDRHDGKNMQRIVEVYDLGQPLEPQLDAHRAANCPPRPEEAYKVIGEALRKGLAGEMGEAQQPLPDRKAAVAATKARNG